MRRSAPGLPTAKLDEVVGVVKAYSSCVGEGPLCVRMVRGGGPEAPGCRRGIRRQDRTAPPGGPIDLVATRYGVEVQGATNIALTKLDILSYMDKIPVCAHYELDGQQTDEFPSPVCLQDAKPVIEYVDGWKCDISKASAAGTSCRKTPGTTWSMWSGPSAVTSAMCPWARSGTASSSADPSNLDRTSRFL